MRFGLHDSKGFGLASIPNNILEKKITNSRDHLCSSNPKI
jgi:hypothetical protein